MDDMILAEAELSKLRFEIALLRAKVATMIGSSLPSIALNSWERSGLRKE